MEYKKLLTDLKLTPKLILITPIYYTCDKQVLWELCDMGTLVISKCYGKVRVLFFPRDNSDFTRQVAHFTRSWSSGKMLAFQPRGFVF